ncbi:MAG TPA: hypothetical protein VFM03_05845 [Candidatus Limnocylindria bacterium]|nr:hypothetical protein [Candidatus Limnocylindria bacterium]
MTEVNGLRLAYRGFVAGLAGAYVWIAVAMLLSLPTGGPMAPVQALGSIGPEGARTSTSEALVLGLGLVQLAGAGVGMAFAYFFGRFFTVRATLATAAVCVAILAWSLVGSRVGIAIGVDEVDLVTSLALLAATIGYGWVVGVSVPVRGEVLRYDSSPVT